MQGRASGGGVPCRLGRAEEEFKAEQAEEEFKAERAEEDSKSE